jgi:site-specific recombinase XerD
VFNALSDFILYCRIERRLAELTCKAYERDVRACLDFLRGQGIAALTEIRTRDLRAFLAEEATHRPAPSSQGRTVAALRCFFRFCVQSDYCERDPAHVLSTPKKREALPDVLGRAELSRLLDMPGSAGVWERLHAGKVERDRLLPALFAYGGLRRAELLGIDCEDVDLDRRLLRIRNAKGGRDRVVPIHPGLVPLFLAYAKARPESRDPALFLGVYGKRLTASIVALTFRRQHAQDGDTPYATPRVRDRASQCGREPTPDSRAARAQAPGLYTALHAGERVPAPGRRQAAAVARHTRAGRSAESRRSRARRTTPCAPAAPRSSAPGGEVSAP